MPARVDLLGVHLDAADPTFAHGPTPPACRGHDPELWYAPGASGDALRAKAICRRCPLMAECQDWAITTRQEFGILGGLDPDERREVLKARRQDEFINAIIASARAGAS